MADIRRPGIRLDIRVRTSGDCESCGGEDFNYIVTVQIGDRQPVSYTLCSDCRHAFARGTHRVAREASTNTIREVSRA